MCTAFVVPVPVEGVGRGVAWGEEGVVVESCVRCVCKARSYVVSMLIVSHGHSDCFVSHARTFTPI